jgi:hypothetical protein
MSNLVKSKPVTDQVGMVAKIENSAASNFMKKLEIDLRSISASQKDPKLLYKPFYEVSLDITEMVKYTPQIKDLLNVDSKITRAKILEIINRNLSMNLKGRIVDNKYAVNCIVDFIVKRCQNAEIQEIDYIFRCGVMGMYGAIYNDISIDTICGAEGWVESYYINDRPNRPEPQFITNASLENKYSVLIPTGNKDEYERDLYRREWKERENPITIEQFFEKNPEYIQKKELSEIYGKAKTKKITIDDARQFYLIKGFTLNEFKDDMEYYSQNFYKAISGISKVEKEIYDLSTYIEIHVNELNQDLKYMVKKLTEKKLILSHLRKLEIDGESIYIKEMHRRFILDNVYKSKE